MAMSQSGNTLEKTRGITERAASYLVEMALSLASLSKTGYVPCSVFFFFFFTCGIDIRPGDFQSPALVAGVELL